MAPRLLCLLSGTLCLTLTLGCARWRQQVREVPIPPESSHPATETRSGPYIKPEQHRYLATFGDLVGEKPALLGAPIRQVLDPTLAERTSEAAKEISPAPVPQQTTGDAKPPVEPVRQAQKVEVVKEQPALVEAIGHILANRPDKALAPLQRYDQATQELFIRLLPVLAELSKKSVEEMSPAEIAAIGEQLRGIWQMLRPRSQFAIDKMCYCQWIRSYGVYQPLPDSHGFMPSTPAHPGDEVHLYVEFRNFASELRGNFYETRLASTLEIRPANAEPDAKPIWNYDLHDRKNPFRARSMLNDLHHHYVFRVPQLPAGNYVLVLQVVDETRPEPRVARKALEFRVNSVSARVP